MPGAVAIEQLRAGQARTDGERTMTRTQRARTEPAPRFALGRLTATPGALDRLTRDELRSFIERHRTGDWGDCTPEDWAANDRAAEARHGGRLLSVYHTANGAKVWVITEAGRHSTTVLLPHEY